VQKEVAVIRLLKDSSSEVDSKFDRQEFFKPLKEWRFYLRMFLMSLVIHAGNASTLT